MAISTTNQSMFIIERSAPFESLEIQFVPGEISVPRQANIAEFTVVGRNNELNHFITGVETCTFTLDFLSDQEDRRDVIQKVDWLKSLTMNDGDTGKYRNVILSMGELFQDWLCIVTRVEPTLSHLDGNAGWLPIRASVKVTFKRDPETNLKISDVRR